MATPPAPTAPPRNLIRPAAHQPPGRRSGEGLQSVMDALARDPARESAHRGHDMLAAMRLPHHPSPG
jgi:hypothetical protein